MFEHAGQSSTEIARARRLRTEMTRSERRLWQELRKLDAHIRRQAPIGRYVADFACHAKRLVIEIDGELHERLAEVALRDHERSEWLRAQGYRVVRFTNGQVDADVFGVVEEVRQHLALPLDGEGLGWGAASEVMVGAEKASAPKGANRPDALRAPQSPTLSPSRGKGVDAQTLTPSRGKGD